MNGLIMRTLHTAENFSRVELKRFTDFSRLARTHDLVSELSDEERIDELGHSKTSRSTEKKTKNYGQS